MQKAHKSAHRKAYGYVRVSSERQASDGDSIHAQRRAIELVCELEGFDLVEIYTDPAVSGSVPLARRAGGQALLSALRAGDVVVGVKLDRMFRDAHDAAGTLKSLKKRCVGLYLRDLGGEVTASNVSALVFGLLSNVAEFERSRISERISEVKRIQRAQSRFLGGCVPLGFTVKVDALTAKKNLLPDEVVQAEARKLRSQGYSARAAAGHLVALGHQATHKSVISLWLSMDQLSSSNS